MNSFISLTPLIHEVLKKVFQSDIFHVRWLNTLSYLENCGARKIAACEHPTLVREEILKHASEEFRHAYYLKCQIKKITNQAVKNYSSDHLMGGISALHYLNSLDLKTSRYLKQAGIPSMKIKEYSYYLVTYAIELRAQELYPCYAEYLKLHASKVRVNSILVEELEHLQEMSSSLTLMKNGLKYAQVICGYEADLCRNWLQQIIHSIDSGLQLEI